MPSNAPATATRKVIARDLPLVFLSRGRAWLRIRRGLPRELNQFSVGNSLSQGCSGVRFKLRGGYNTGMRNYLPASRELVLLSRGQGVGGC